MTGREQRRVASLKWVVTAEDAGVRLDAWLSKRAEIHSRSRAREWIERGKVFVNARELTFDRAGERVRAGDEITVWVDRPGSSRPRSRDIVTRRDALRIVFEDAWLLVADKPPGLLVEPLPGDRSEVTLCDLVSDYLRKSEGLVVHRIDRDTSGLVVFAKNEPAQVVLKRQFERRTAERAYLAVLTGRLLPPEGTWKDKLVWEKSRLRQRRARDDDEQAAKDAIASYKVLEQFGQAAVVEIRLVTGKRNQIRIQAALRHHPLVGERIYKQGDQGLPAPSFSRQALHASRLAFRHPHTGARVQFEAPLPEDMRRLVAMLRATPPKRY